MRSSDNHEFVAIFVSIENVLLNPIDYNRLAAQRYTINLILGENEKKNAHRDVCGTLESLVQGGSVACGPKKHH